jgi:two-component system nitrate/nitrite response regulator NarL
MINTAIVDDDPLAIRAMRDMLAPYMHEMTVGAACRTVDELIQVWGGKPPDVVLLDVMLGSRAPRLAANVGRLREWGAHVLAISAQPDRREVAEAVRLLRLNFLAKTDLTEEAFRKAIEDTAAGDLVLSPQLMEAIVLSDDDPALTEREKQVMRLLASGMSPKMVARRLGTREDTVRKHQISIRDKYRNIGRPIDNPVQLHYAALHDEIITDRDDAFDGESRS